MHVLDVIELWFYGMYPDYGRALLRVERSGEGGQIYVKTFMDALPHVADSMAGLCGVRTSLQPRGRDINEVPLLESVLFDNDSPENLELAKYTALKQLEMLKQLGGSGVIIFTGGKGYSVRAWLDKQYAKYVQQYRRIASSIAELFESYAFAKTELLHEKALVRVPYSTHEKTGNRVLVFDGERHVYDPDVAYKLIVQAIENPIPFYEDFVKAEPELKPLIIKEEEGEKKRKRLPKFVERLIATLKETGELCHKGRFAIAAHMIAAGYDDGEIVDVFRYAKDFDEKKTRYQIVQIRNKGYTPPSCETVAKDCGIAGLCDS